MLDYLRQCLLEVFELYQVRAKVNAFVIELTRLRFSSTTLDSKESQHINIVLAHLGDPSSDNLLELFACNHFAMMFLIFPTKPYVDLITDLTYLILARVNEMSATF